MTPKKGRPIATDGLRIAIFEYKNIVEFLRYLIEVQGSARGIRSRLAEAAGCHPSYFSQVLAGTSNLSHEQLFGIARFLELNDDEWDYVRELGLLERAGNDLLAQDCRKRLLRIRTQARTTVNLAPTEPAQAPDESARIDAEFMLWSVSTWQVSAILAAVALPKLNTEAALARVLGMPMERMKELIRTLLERNILKRGEKGTLSSNLPPQMYLGGEVFGQLFRAAWIQRGLAKTQSGYRDGFQKGGVFRASRAEYAALKAKMQAVHREFHASPREPEACEMIGYFGIDIFEA